MVRVSIFVIEVLVKCVSNLLMFVFGIGVGCRVRIEMIFLFFTMEQVVRVRFIVLPTWASMRHGQSETAQDRRHNG